MISSCVQAIALNSVRPPDSPVDHASVEALLEPSIEPSSEASSELLFEPLSKHLEELVTIPPLSECQVCVIIPVRNEAESLETTLTALLNQQTLQGQPLALKQFEVIVLANNCTDNSAVIARQFAERHPDFVLHVVERSFAPAQAYIGRVRQILMDEGYRRLIAIKKPRGIVASTDGDTEVAPTWIAAIQHEIALGADAVSGRIMAGVTGRNQLDPYTRACYLRAIGYGYLCVELEAYIDPDPFDRLPRHHQHCGASLAVTAEMYGKAGGLPAVRTPEDVAFYRSLLRVEAKFRHSPLVWVKTSTRRQGRTSNGMANQLNQWSIMGQQRQTYLVESVAAVETKLRQRRQLRQTWQRYRQQDWHWGEAIKLARQFGIDADWFCHEFRQASCFGALYDRVLYDRVLYDSISPDQVADQRLETRHAADHGSRVPIEQAIAELRVRISQLRQTCS